MADILIADDELSVRETLRRLLEGHGHRVRAVDDGSKVLKELEGELPDLILLDVTMPVLNGIQATRAVRSHPKGERVPILIVSAEGDESSRIRGIEAGADDYITKPFVLDELVARVERNLRRSSFERHANPLTGLPGSPRIQKEAQRRMVAGENFFLVYVDADHFKAFNDAYGYAKGDEVLKKIASVLETVLSRHRDFNGFLGHIGGDDFVFLGGGNLLNQVCDAICAEFDAAIPSFYKAEDREKGYLEAAGRDGDVARFPLVRLTLAVVEVRGAFRLDYEKYVEIASDLKKLGKREPDRSGSKWFQEKPKS